MPLDRLTILYTHDLRGNLSVLPQLATWIDRLKQGRGAVCVLDIGGSCAPDVWHCVATQGRSTAVVLDAMGYHAANIADALDAPNRAKLARTTQMALLDSQHIWRYHVPPHQEAGIVVAIDPQPALTLCIVARPHPQTTLEGGILYLGAVAPLSVGVVTVNLLQSTLERLEAQPMPVNLPPNATISGVVDFVEEEAQSA